MTGTLKTTELLKTILAENVQLYALTQNVHWNVTGPLFQPVHALTEEHYTDLATATDDIAERIRALGSKAPASLQAFEDLGSIKNISEDAKATDMLEALIAGNQTLASRLKSGIAAATDGEDDVTAGLLTDRLTAHEKAIWMYRAMLEE